MDRRYALTTAIASVQFGAISIEQLQRLTVDRKVRYEWVQRGLIERLGPRSYAVVGSAVTWERSVWSAAADVDGKGFLAGRTAARLQGLNGFHGRHHHVVEILLPRRHGDVRTPHRVATTGLPLSRIHTVVIDGFRCLTAERLILDAPLFSFSRDEIENAIDSAIRLKLISEQRLRSGVISRRRRSINGGRALLDALVDTGGESRLERWFLGIEPRGPPARRTTPHRTHLAR